MIDFSFLHQKSINSYLVIMLITLSLPSCVTIKKADIKVQDEGAVRLITEGGKLYDRGRYDEALGKFSAAEAETSLPQDKIRIADILSKGGFDLFEKKLFDAALSYYNQSLKINRVLDNKPGLVNDYSYMGSIYTDIGKYDEAILHFNQAIELQKDMNDKAGVVHNLNNLANLHGYLGDYQESINLLNRALQISRSTDVPTQTARTLINLAAIDFRLRNYEKSIDYLNQALQIADRVKNENLKAEALNLTGVVYREQGEFDKALANYLAALKINKKEGVEAAIITSLSTIGELYKETGRYGQALQYIQESLHLSRESKNQLMTAVNLNYMGEVRYKQGKYDQALNLYQSSLGIFEELGFRDRIARSYNNIGYLRGETGQWDSAIENLDKAISIYKDLGDREWVRISLFGRGLYSEEKGDLLSAEKNYKEAVDIFESVREDVAGGLEAEQTFSDVNVEIYERLVSLLLRLGKDEEALEYIERSRSKNLRDTFLRSGISSFDERTRGLLERFDELFRKEASINYQLVRERAKALPNPEKIDNLVKTLARTREEFMRINSALESENPKLYGLLSIKPEDVAELVKKNRLPGDVIFVEYFITDKETYIFLMSDRDLKVKTVSAKKEELAELVKLFRDLIELNKSIPSNRWRDDQSEEYEQAIKPLKKTSSTLYAYLIEPIEAEIAPAETIAVIPFGSLHYLPFNALAKERDDGTLEFLIERKKLVYIVSASANYLDVVLGNGRKRGIESLVAFGNPDLGEPDLALPYSQEEVKAIKTLFPNATVFLGKDATKYNFESNWGVNDIIHMATHAVVKGTPSILLAPLGTGSLTLKDITGLPPAENTHLVVLSACQAAVVSDEDGHAAEELNSIALAFSMVGTPSVIATLWRIEDKATFELMEDFYENLKKEGRFDYEALRRAQLEMLKRPDKYGQPFYWAPFILMGVWE
ncbi:MAG TPA: CHAT domain-containing tetratricopeptide repeat protein [Thermodesulfobacteriota bacterium]|nr:CHAT domain-containing tetratricopeptide repeat protein [Thermodesulfobacteriota bacterium]